MSPIVHACTVTDGWPTREVQHQLTHSSLESIERYAKVTRAGLSRVMFKIA